MPPATALEAWRVHCCFVTSGVWERNASRYRTRGLGQALAARGIQVTYLVDDCPENRRYFGEQPQLRPAYVPGPRGLGQVRGRRQLLDDLRPDFVHLLNPTPVNFVTVAGNRRLKIVTEWDEPPAFKPWPWRRKLLVRALDRWFRRRADLVIVCAEYLKTHFENVRPCRVLYLPHATYLPDQGPDGPSPFQEPTAIYLGSLYPEFDADVLFSAMLLLAGESCRPRLQLMGQGPELPKWQTLVREKGLHNVELLGYTEGNEFWPRLRHAHVLLFPIRETVFNKTRCPTKLFAYAQARRPVVTNRVGEVPALLGDAATYIECTPRAFADAIRQVMHSPRLPDVDYGIERHNYDARAAALLERLKAL